MAVSAPPGRTMYAIYDLGRAPVTYDAMNFLVVARLWASRRGFSGFHTIFVRAPNEGFRDQTPKDRTLTVDEKVWRLSHILMPMAAAARDCVGVSIVNDRRDLGVILKNLDAEQIFPPNYTVEEPFTVIFLAAVFRLSPTESEMNTFQPSPAGLGKVDEWLAARVPGGRPVVITLRTSRVEPERNSRTAEWLAAARAIRDRGYPVLFVPDTELVTGGCEDREFEDFPVFALGAMDLDLRLAMYRRALLNMADNGGPSFLNFYMEDSKIVCFLPVDKLPIVVAAGGESRLALLLGMELGGNFPYGSPVRRLVWRPDRAPAILEEFDRSIAALES